MSTFNVTSLDDSGPGTLRSGIKYANVNPGTNIVFNVTGTITLKSSLPFVVKTTTIVSILSSEGKPQITINGVKKYSTIKIEKTSNCIINGLCIINSSCSGIAIVKSELNKIYNCWIGVDLLGNKASNLNQGILITESDSNQVGSNDLLNQEYFSNVISGNNKSGIYICKSKLNKIENNIIGLNNTCDQIISNNSNGIELKSSTQNIIGGTLFVDNNFQANDPTGDKGTKPPTFVRPLLGNIISGNNKNGIKINKSDNNDVSGNFIGTDNTGNINFGNKENGIEIKKSEFTNISGCAFNNQPFVYYNVISGNNKYGIFNYLSKYTTIQANFIGIGADNSTKLSNNIGIVDEDSIGTVVGGIIPLGNVVSGNIIHGIHVTGNSSGFSSVNTFTGIKAFGDALPNGVNGFLFDKKANDIRLNTNVISGNNGNGIKFTDEVSNVLLSSNIIGLNTDGLSPIPNGLSGIVISGNVNNINTFVNITSVIQRNIVSGNLEYGIVLSENSNNNIITQTTIGLDYLSTFLISNGKGGLLITDKSNNNLIGTDLEFSKLNYLCDEFNFAVKLTKNTFHNTVINNNININIEFDATPHNKNIINDSTNNIVYANNLPYESSRHK